MYALIATYKRFLTETINEQKFFQSHRSIGGQLRITELSIKFSLAMVEITTMLGQQVFSLTEIV